MTEIWYRCEGQVYDSSGPCISFNSYPIISQTDKTVLIDYYGKKKRILKNARKRFAYPTKELAIDSFIHRKDWQARRAQHTLDNALQLKEYATAYINNGMKDPEGRKDSDDMFEFD